jgi:hypothetical protein
MLFINSKDCSKLLEIDGQIDSIVFCHGINCNDNIENFNAHNFQSIIDVNVTMILNITNLLFENNKFAKNGNIVIISSIWEEFVRDNKLSYSVSKSALSAVSKSLACDLAKYNVLVNNILPGVIDNDMSRSTLSDKQINHIKNYVGFDRLVSLDDVFSLVKYLVLENTGITGQSIKVDLGFTNIKKYS